VIALSDGEISEHWTVCRRGSRLALSATSKMETDAAGGETVPRRDYLEVL